MGTSSRVHKVALAGRTVAFCLGSLGWATGVDARVVSPAPESAVVRVGHQPVFELGHALDGQDASTRAARASTAMDRALRLDSSPVRVDVRPGRATVSAGDQVIVVLGPDDVPAGTSAGLEPHAHAVAAEVEAALEDERIRRGVAGLIYAWSMVVFSGLIAFVLGRRVLQLLGRIRRALHDRPSTALRVGALELLPASATRVLVQFGHGVGRASVLVLVTYGWSVFSLSRFDATRSMARELTAAVTAPLGDLATRLGGAVPVALVVVFAVGMLAMLLRLVGAYFASVGADEHGRWPVPPAAARSLSVTAQVSVAALAFVLGSSIVTGSSTGAGYWLGLMLVGLVGVAVLPLAISLGVGLQLALSGQVAVDRVLSFGADTGRVCRVGLFDFSLSTEHANVVRVPYLALLFAPLVERDPDLTIELEYEAGTYVDREIAALQQAAAAVDLDVDVVPLRFERDRCVVGIRLTAANRRREAALREVVTRHWSHSRVAISSPEPEAR